MARTGNTYENWLRGDNLINIQGLWFLGSALPLIAIYLYTKFYLNVNSSLKVICQTRYRIDRWTDGQTKQGLYASTFGEHNKTFYLTHIISMRNSASNIKSASHTDS